MGAMENAGAVTLRDEYLPRSRQDASFYEFRCSVILHEMAHMWFGDLVTMKWWDDLWLNESFAEWACYHAAVEATEFDESWTGFTNARKNWALRQDQLPSTHPIAADNYDLQAVEVNFDGITYAKGASVLKQLVAWVGLDNFLVGLRAYFKKHAFSNSEFSDLLSALEEASGRELDSWAKEWLQTSGVNTLTPQFEVDDEGSYTSFSVVQSATIEHSTLRRHRIGIGLYDAVDGHLVRRTYVEVDVEGETTAIAELVGVRQPDLLLLNDGDLTYAKIRLDERSLETVVSGLARLDDSLARALCWGAAWDMTRDAEMSATDFVAARAGQHRGRDRRVRLLPDPGVRRPGRQQLLRTGQPGRVARDLGAGRPPAARRGRARAATTSSPSCARWPRPRTATPCARRPRGTARRLDGDRRPGHRHRPALEPPVRAGPRRSRRRRPDRRRAAPRQHHLRPRARRGRAGVPAHGRGEGRGVGDRGRARRRAQRDPAQRRALLHAARPGRAARSPTSRSTSRRPRRSGRRRAPSAPRPPWSSSSRARWPPASCSTASAPGCRSRRPTPPRSVTCTRVPPTSSATWPARRRTRGAEVVSFTTGSCETGAKR